MTKLNKSVMTRWEFVLDPVITATRPRPYGSHTGSDYEIHRVVCKLWPDEGDGTYLDVEFYGYRLTTKGEHDNRQGYHRIYLSLSQWRTDTLMKLAQDHGLDDLVRAIITEEA